MIIKYQNLKIIFWGIWSAAEFPSSSLYRLYHRSPIWITIRRMYLLGISLHIPLVSHIFYTYRYFIVLFNRKF
jgi:hypothetical protein